MIVWSKKCIVNVLIFHACIKSIHQRGCHDSRIIYLILYATGAIKRVIVDRHRRAWKAFVLLHGRKKFLKTYTGSRFVSKVDALTLKC